MPGSSLLRSLSTFGVVILGAASACVHAASAQDPPLPALAGDQGVMNVTLIGTVHVEPPWDPEGEGFFSTTDLFIDGDHVYMGSRSGLLHIIDISDPTDMKLASQIMMPGQALDVKVADNLAVVSVQNGPVNDIGAVMVDVTDPASPAILSHVEDPFWSGVHNSYIYNDRVYLAHSASRGITVVDVSNPSRPFISGTWLNEEPGMGSIIHDRRGGHEPNTESDHP